MTIDRKQDFISIKRFSNNFALWFMGGINQSDIELQKHC